MEIYLATSNTGRVDHASNILPDSFTVKQLEINTVEPSIDSIEKISRSELEQVLAKTEINDAYIMTDDSGLFIDSLNGFPGPQTSFFDEKVG